MNHWTTIDGGITAPRGYEASGVFCGIRKKKKDIAVIRSLRPANVAAVFTRSKTLAAPVIIDKATLKRSKLCSAIIINSGNANACTGERGMNDAETMVALTASLVGVPRDEALVASTGVIGQYLPMVKITAGIAQAVAELSSSGSKDAAEAIMTTDTFAKEYAVNVDIAGATITIGGIAKGSGMIAPNMATMLGFITTDASIDQVLAQDVFTQSVERTFNRISVDGDMSTNDMAALLANGMAQNNTIMPGTDEATLFANALEHVLITLAKMIARDGEGATKLIEVKVHGASTEKAAVMAARSVANSNLVKTAIHGEDANWGRVLAALGYSGVDLDPADIELAFNELPVLGKDYAILIDEDAAKQALADSTITLSINLNQGAASASFWTCDLSKEYVHINASYRS